jgi:hypothetical protein
VICDDVPARYFAARSGSVPIFARPSVMRMIFLLPDDTISAIYADKRASPIFVPESQDLFCRILSVVIESSISIRPFLSDDGGENINGFPAKITRAN